MSKAKKDVRAAAKATAKIEAVAKATYQRKGTTTEVIPPDVSRAKAGAWLSLISPITEWAGLKGDALNFRRRLLRIQQEETLLRVATSVRAKLSGEEFSAVPRKILIPALEKASLEEPDDEVMIERWASLLASAAQKVKVQPRFVGILDELAGPQAKCLERIAFNRHADFNFPGTSLADSFIEFAEYNIRQAFEAGVDRILKLPPDVDATMDMIVREFNRPGVALEVAFIIGHKAEIWADSDSESIFVLSDQEDLAILESLGLIRRSLVKFGVLLKHHKERLEISAHYIHLTQLGVEFCRVCSNERVNELERIGATSASKGLRHREPFA